MNNRTYCTLEDCQTRAQSKIIENIEKNGWSLVGVFGEEEGDFGHVYTVGLEHSFEHPEIAVVGVPFSTASGLLNGLAGLIADGRRFRPGEKPTDLPVRGRIRFDSIARHHYEDYLNVGRWFYKGEEFRALQIVWPGPDGRYPDDPLYAGFLGIWQPLLRD